MLWYVNYNSTRLFKKNPFLMIPLAQHAPYPVFPSSECGLSIHGASDIILDSFFSLPATLKSCWLFFQNTCGLSCSPSSLHSCASHSPHPPPQAFGSLPNGSPSLPPGSHVLPHRALRIPFTCFKRHPHHV